MKSKKLNTDYYVYILIDPRNNEEFYVGKGKIDNNRHLAHEKEAEKNIKSEWEKIKRINEIKSAGFEIKYSIFADNCTEEEAFNNEDLLITHFRNNHPGQLTNIQGGHKSKFTTPSEQMKDNCETREPVVFDDERILLIKQNHSWDYHNNDNERYENFRGDWFISEEKKDKVELICIVYNNIIKYVCKPTNWIRKEENCFGVRYKNPRYQFEGEIVNKQYKKYINKCVKDYKKIVRTKNGVVEKNLFGTGSVIGYINIK